MSSQSSHPQHSTTTSRSVSLTPPAKPSNRSSSNFHFESWDHVVAVLAPAAQHNNLTVGLADATGQTVQQVKESTFLKRYATIDEQVAPILFLASDEASYVTGGILSVAGGDLG